MLAKAMVQEMDEEGFGNCLISIRCSGADPSGHKEHLNLSHNPASFEVTGRISTIDMRMPDA